MHQEKGKIAISFLLVCCVVFFLVDTHEVANHTAKPAQVAFGAEVNGYDVPWSRASLSATDAPPMALVLARVQGIRSFLFLLESRRAAALSVSLSTLAGDVERHFGQQLYSPFNDLSAGEQNIYSEVLQMVIELERIVQDLDVPAREVKPDLAS